MKRWLLNIILVLSLLLFVGTAALWVRSYRTRDVVERQGGSTADHILTFSGGLTFGHISRPFSLPVNKFSYRQINIPKVNFITTPHSWRWLGFTATHEEYASVPSAPGGLAPRSANNLPGYGVWTLSIPFWFLMLLFALPACLRVRTVLGVRRRRRRLNLCPKCGYDLRASKERCPECGTAIPAGPVEGSGKSMTKVKAAVICTVAAGMLAVCMVVASRPTGDTATGLAAMKPAAAVPAGTAVRKPATSAPTEARVTAPVATGAAVRETAWGEVVNGLQVGLLIEDGKRSWRIGESFSIAFLVRNVSEQRIELAYAVAGGRGEAYVYPYGLLVRDRDGQFGYYHLPTNRGAMIPQTSLAPGESQILRSSKMTIWPIGLDRTPEPGTLMVEPGKYSLSQVDIQMDPGFWVGVGVRSTAGLSSGTVELEVLPARPDDPLLKAVATQPARSYSTADMKAALSVMGHFMQMNVDVVPMGMGNKDAWHSEQRAVEMECAMLSDGAVDFLGHLATTRSDEMSRRLASRLLESCKRDRTKDFLLQGLTDESADVRSAAARAIWDFGTPEVIARLLQMLKKDEVARVRGSAAMALGHIGNQKVTVDLIEALKSDQDAGVQRDIMIALSWLKDRAAIPALEEMRKTNPEPDYQRWITNLVRSIEEPKPEGTVRRPATRTVNDSATQPAVMR